MSKVPVPSCASVVVASQVTDNTFASAIVTDNEPIQANISLSALVLSFPCDFVPALISQPRVVARASDLEWSEFSSSTKYFGLEAADVDFNQSGILLSYFCYLL
jgi:hypothetical protein